MNDLHFSANGLGVVLKTKHGGLRFTTEEFGYYQNLFIIADSHNQGKLVLNDVHINSLLIRTDVEWAVIEKVLSVAVKHRTDGEENVIYFYQWLMICKLIAYHQETSRAVNDKVFKSLHTSKVKIPFANFNLTQARQEFLAGSYFEDFRVSLGDWVLAGDAFQDQHVKFRIETVATTFNRSDIPAGAAANGSADQHNSGTNGSDGSNPNSAGNQDKYSVERRYSEFQTFASLLQKNYRHVVVPPLPVKNWNPSSLLTAPDAVANQRAIEFQLFLNDLAVHPVLKYSFELKAFLECSSQGLKSFSELYSHMQDGKLDFSSSPTSANVNEIVAKLLADSAAAVTTSASAFFSTMWDTVKRNVPLLATPPVSRPASNEHDVVFNKTLFFLEGVLNVGRKLEAIVAHEQGYQSELAKIAQCCKNMAEFETIPELSRVLNLSAASLAGISRTQLQYTDAQHLRAEIPLLFMGRYKESYQLVLQQRAKLEDEQQSAAKAEIVAQHNVEKAHALVAASGAPFGAGGYPGGAHQGSNGHTVPKASPAGEAPHTPLANGKGNGAVSSPNTTTSSNSSTTSPVAAAASTASPSAPSTLAASNVVLLSPAEQKAAAAEKAFNQAKLDLAAAEDYFEQKRGAAEQMNASLRAESARLEALERAHLMKCAKEFVLARMEAARSNVRAWEEFKLELQNSTS